MRSIGYVASSGSRILVPNIVDLSTGAASSALSAVGLVLGSSTGSTSSGATSSNNGYVASQSISAGSYADYGTTITYTTYAYVPPPSPPVWTDSSISNSFTAGSGYLDSVSATNGASYQIIQDTSCYGDVINPYWVTGVTLDSSTGVISGTPTTAGQPYAFKIRAYNAGGFVDSQSYCGTVGTPSGTVTSVTVEFDAATSSSQLTGNIRYVNNTGATYSISITSSAGTVSPSSFLSNGFSQTVTNQSFTVSGLSPGQTVTVTASGGNASASSSATTLTSSPSYTYTFSYQFNGTSGLSCSGTITSQGSQYYPSTGNLTIDAGLCGSQTFYAFSPGTWYWICCRT